MFWCLCHLYLLMISSTVVVYTQSIRFWQFTCHVKCHKLEVWLTNDEWNKKGEHGFHYHLLWCQLIMIWSQKMFNSVSPLLLLLQADSVEHSRSQVGFSLIKYRLSCDKSPSFSLFLVFLVFFSLIKYRLFCDKSPSSSRFYEDLSWVKQESLAR